MNERIETRSFREEAVDHDRTGKPVLCPQRGASRSQEIETRSFREEAVDHDRTGKPVVCPQRRASRSEDIGTRSSHEEAVHHDRTGKPVVCPQRRASRSQEIETRSFREEAVDHDRTGKPVLCPQRGASRSQEIETRSFREKETKHDRTVKPVVCSDTDHEHSILNEVDIDFRILGLPHSVVKKADNYRVRELVKKIENHPHWQSLQRGLQQDEAHNPFSAKSKKMIQDVGNVEQFELFETDPETQCKACLSYWSEGIVYCTCGHLLKETVANRGFIEYTLDLVSIPNYVIVKGRPHGHIYGKTNEQKEYHQAHNSKKRCIKRRFKRDSRSIFERS